MVYSVVLKISGIKNKSDSDLEWQNQLTVKNSLHTQHKFLTL